MNAMAKDEFRWKNFFNFIVFLEFLQTYIPPCGVRYEVAIKETNSRLLMQAKQQAQIKKH